MKVNVRNSGSFRAVVAEIESAKIGVGFLDEDEAKELAASLIDAAYALGPQFATDCDPWFIALLNERGISVMAAKLEDGK